MEEDSNLRASLQLSEWLKKGEKDLQSSFRELKTSYRPHLDTSIFLEKRNSLVDESLFSLNPLSYSSELIDLDLDNLDHINPHSQKKPNEDNPNLKIPKPSYQTSLFKNSNTPILKKNNNFQISIPLRSSTNDLSSASSISDTNASPPSPSSLSNTTSSPPSPSSISNTISSPPSPSSVPNSMKKEAGNMLEEKKSEKFPNISNNSQSAFKKVIPVSHSKIRLSFTRTSQKSRKEKLSNDRDEKERAFSFDERKDPKKNPMVNSKEKLGKREMLHSLQSLKLESFVKKKPSLEMNLKEVEKCFNEKDVEGMINLILGIISTFTNKGEMKSLVRYLISVLLEQLKDPTFSNSLKDEKTFSNNLKIFSFLMILCEDVSCSVEFRESLGLVILTKIFSFLCEENSGDELIELSFLSIKLLNILLEVDEECKNVIGHFGILPLFLLVINSPLLQISFVIQIVLSLSFILEIKENQNFFLRNGGLDIILPFTEKYINPQLTIYIILSLSHLVTNKFSKNLFSVSLLNNLFSMLTQNENENVRSRAFKVITHYTNYPKIREEISKYHFIPIISSFLSISFPSPFICYSLTSISNYCHNQKDFQFLLPHFEHIFENLFSFFLQFYQKHYSSFPSLSHIPPRFIRFELPIFNYLSDSSPRYSPRFTPPHSPHKHSSRHQIFSSQPLSLDLSNSSNSFSVLRDAPNSPSSNRHSSSLTNNSNSSHSTRRSYQPSSLFSSNHPSPRSSTEELPSPLISPKNSISPPPSPSKNLHSPSSSKSLYPTSPLRDNNHSPLREVNSSFFVLRSNKLNQNKNLKQERNSEEKSEEENQINSSSTNKQTNEKEKQNSTLLFLLQKITKTWSLFSSYRNFFFFHYSFFILIFLKKKENHK